MKMSKNFKKACLVVALGTALSATVVDAANYTKSLKATYRDISVNYNGTAKTLSAEPFLVDGSTYVPLRAVSEIMGANVNWDGSTGVISITNNASDTTALQQELATKTYQVTTLTRELEEAKAELAKYKDTTSSGSSVSTTALNKTLLAIQEEFENEERITWDFDLTETKAGKLELTVSYDSKSDGSRFNRLSYSTLKGMMNDMCALIRNNHKDIEIVGKIVDSRYDWSKATLTYSKTNKLTFSLMSDNYADTAKTLLRYYSSFNKIAHNATATTEAGEFTLPIKGVSLTDDNSMLIFTVSVDLSTTELKAKWNAIKGSDTTIEDTLYDMQRDVEDEYDNIDVEGIIVDSSNNDTVIATISAGGKFYYK